MYYTSTPNRGSWPHLCNRAPSFSTGALSSVRYGRVNFNSIELHCTVMLGRMQYCISLSHFQKHHLPFNSATLHDVTRP